MKMNEDHEALLDGIRESGIMNMVGATPVLMAHFDLSQQDARAVLAEWMDSKTAPDVW